MIIGDNVRNLSEDASILIAELKIRLQANLCNRSVTNYNSRANIDIYRPMFDWPIIYTLQNAFQFENFNIWI